MRQLVGQYANHGFVGSQTCEKNSAELDRTWLAQKDRCVIACINVGPNATHSLYPRGGCIDPGSRACGSIEIIFLCQLNDSANDQSPGGGQHTLGSPQTRDRVRMAD